MALPGLEQCKVIGTKQRLQACKWHDVIKDWPDPYKRIPKAIHTVEAPAATKLLESEAT